MHGMTTTRTARQTQTQTRTRALSLWRPWPWLVLHADKRTENRSWSTRYRGLLVLHAGRGLDQHLVRAAPPLPREAYTYGFVGTVQLVEVHPAAGCRRCDRTWAGDHGYHWVLNSPRAFGEVVPGGGRQGLFTPPPAVLTALTVRGATA